MGPSICSSFAPSDSKGQVVRFSAWRPDPHQWVLTELNEKFTDAGIRQTWACIEVLSLT